MSLFLLRRLLHSVLVVWGAVSIIFVIVRLVPGDPASVMLGPSASVEQVEALRARLGLDQPMLNQYATFMRDVLVLDFGESTRLGISASQAVIRRLPATVALGVTGMLVAVLVAFPLGVRATRVPGGLADRTIRFLSLVGQMLPTFWVGIMLLLIFSRGMRLLPSAGSATPAHFILPVITLALPLIGTLVRLVRSGMLEVLGEPYVQAVRAKGIRDRSVLYRHAVPNMLIPVVTVLGLMLGDLIGGLVLVETVFAWPGIGRLLVDSILDRDYAVVQACVALIAFSYVVINLGVDVLYGYIDPRIRVEGPR